MTSTKQTLSKYLFEWISNVLRKLSVGQPMSIPLERRSEWQALSCTLERRYQCRLFLCANKARLRGTITVIKEGNSIIS